MAERRAANAVHMAQNGLHWHNESMLDTAGPRGMVKALHTELFWDPHSPYRQCWGSRDNYNWLGKLREYSARLFVVIRIYHPAWYEVEPEPYARYYVDLLRRWDGGPGSPYADIDCWQDPYIGIVWANEQNIELPGISACSWWHMPGPTIQDKVRQSVAWYERIADWHTRVWDEVDRLVPDRKALAVWSALAQGHDTSPDMPESEYMVPALNAAVRRCDVANWHPYAHKRSGESYREDGPGEADQYWGLMRSHRPEGYRDALEPGKPHDIGGALAIFPGMPYIEGEAGTFVHDLPDWAQYNLDAMAALWDAGAATGRCLGSAVYIWHGGDDHRPNVIQHSPPLRDGLPLVRKREAEVDWPVARPGKGYGNGDGGTEDMGDRLAALLRQELGDRFTDERERYEGSYRYADSRTMPYCAWHHTVTPRAVTLAQLYREHVEVRGWPGIGYHAVIRLGRLYLLSSPDRQRAHVWGRNTEALGVAITGDYRYQVPADEDLACGRGWVRAIDALYGHAKDLVGHNEIDLPGHETECPAGLGPFIAGLRGEDPQKQLEVAVAAALEQEHRLRGVRANVEAAIWQAVENSSGYLPTTNEIDVTHGGRTYVAQRYEHTERDQDVRYYYVRKQAPWRPVYWFARA